MILNTVFLCYVKFVKYNRSIIGVDVKVHIGLYLALVFIIWSTLTIHIVELVVLKNSQNLTSSYLIINVILILSPYFIYLIF